MNDISPVQELVSHPSGANWKKFEKKNLHTEVNAIEKKIALMCNHSQIYKCKIKVKKEREIK